MTDPKGQEKREHPRINGNFVINYRIQELESSYDLSQTKDVSQGGALLNTNKSFKKGTRLTMNLRIPFIPQRIELEGEVIDSREIVRDLVYETRVSFVGLDDNFFKKLGEFIKESLK